MKLALCVELFEAPRALCRHEVCAFQARAASYGNNLPCRFPSWSIRRPKFHMLTHVMPRSAVRHWTLGLNTEQAVEIFHAVWNRRRHRHWSIRDPRAQMVAQAKDSQRRSVALNPRAHNLLEMKTSKRRACVLPLGGRRTQKALKLEKPSQLSLHS